MYSYQYSNRASHMKPSIIRELLKQMANPNIISFAGGNPDEAAFPVEDIRRISDEIFEKEPIAALQYSVTEGSNTLREVGRDYLNKDFKTITAEDDVIILSGSQQVMDFLTKLLCNEGDIVAIEEPTFLGAINSFASYGVQLKGVPLQNDGVDIEALEKVFAATPKPKFYYTIPNFQNPTGITTSLEKRKAVYDLAVKYQVPILEDNPYGDLRFEGKAIPAIKSFDTQGLVTYAVSFSKFLAPGIRIALCSGEKSLLAKMVVAKQGSDVHTNIWAQKVCEYFLTQVDQMHYLKNLRELYGQKAHFMQTQMNERLTDKITYIHPTGGMFMWAQLPQKINMLDFVQNCLNKNLALVPGNAFLIDGTQTYSHFRMNFASPSKENIEKGVTIMEQVFNSMIK